MQRVMTFLSGRKYTGQDAEINLKNPDGSAAQVAIDSNNTPKAMRFAFGLNLRF